jgi:hypothetical protein
MKRVSFFFAIAFATTVFFGSCDPSENDTSLTQTVFADNIEGAGLTKENTVTS